MCPISTAGRKYSRLYWLILSERLGEVALGLPGSLVGAIDVVARGPDGDERLGRVMLAGNRSVCMDGPETSGTSPCTVFLDDRRSESLLTGKGSASGAIEIDGDARLFETLLEHFESRAAQGWLDAQRC
ncbi:MAG: hypothetical protein AAFQ82_06795 [Myxococcota bacterium]